MNQDEMVDLMDSPEGDQQNVKAVVSVLDGLGYALFASFILAGAAYIGNALSTTPDTSQNSSKIVTLLIGGVVTVLSGAFGAAKTGSLPTGAHRAIKWVGWGFAVFFVMLVAGTLVAGHRMGTGISDNETEIMLMVGQGILSLLAFVAGERAGELAQSPTVSDDDDWDDGDEFVLDESEEAPSEHWIEDALRTEDEDRG